MASYDKPNSVFYFDLSDPRNPEMGARASIVEERSSVPIRQQDQEDRERRRGRRSGSFQKPKVLEEAEEHVHGTQIETTVEVFQKEIKNMQQNIQIKDRKVEDLSNRLGKEILSGAQDDPSFEEISNQNSPLVLRDWYEKITTNNHLSALESLQQTLPDTKHFSSHRIVLCKVFTVAQEKCIDLRNTLMTDLVESIMQPMRYYKTTVSMRCSCRSKGEMAVSSDPSVTSLKRDLCALLMTNARYLDTANMVQDIIQTVTTDQTIMDRVGPEYNLRAFSDDPEVKSFSNEVCRLVWAMMVTTPPVCFETEGEGHRYNEDTQRPYYQCDPRKKGSVVNYYLHPTMMHATQVLTTGLVYIS